MKSVLDPFGDQMRPFQKQLDSFEEHEVQILFGHNSSHCGKSDWSRSKIQIHINIQIQQALVKVLYTANTHTNTNQNIIQIQIQELIFHMMAIGTVQCPSLSTTNHSHKQSQHSYSTVFLNCIFQLCFSTACPYCISQLYIIPRLHLNILTCGCTPIL